MWALSLTRGRVCRLQLLLTLVSAVIFASESHGIRDHILLSQIRDFPFRRLLRLAGLRWRYSIPPPHGSSPDVWLPNFSPLVTFLRTVQKSLNPMFPVSCICGNCLFMYALSRECAYRLVSVEYALLTRNACVFVCWTRNDGAPTVNCLT
jgi:hypothetical protein